MTGRAPERKADRLRRMAVCCAALAFAASLGLACYSHARAQVLPYDDAYITYRYVKNALAGHGLVYNVGEPVFGSSTPLYTLWLLLLAAITRISDIPALAVRSNALLFVAGGVTLVGLAREISRSWVAALLIGTLYALNPQMVDISLGGMESFLFLALFLGALWALCADRLRLAASVAALALLCRPEGALLLALVGLHWLLRKGRKDWLALAIALMVLLPWAVFATLRYGTVVPHSLIAKSAPVYTVPALSAFGEVLGALYAWSGMLLLPVPMGARGALLVALLATATASYGLLRCGEAPARGGSRLVGALWLLVAFYAVANAPLCEWYLPILWALWVLVVALGLAPFARWLAQLVGLKPSARGAVFGAMLALSALLAAGFPLSYYGAAALGRLELEYPFRTPSRLRVQAYRQAAEWLNAAGQAPTSALAAEVGAFGYYFDGQVYDACGLVSPQAVPYLPVPADERVKGDIGAIGSAFARAVEADYVVTIPVFSQKSIDVDPWFLAHYTLVHSIALPAPVWDCSEVVIWERMPTGK